MKTQILKLVKKAFLMVATIAILSCSKKDDDAIQPSQFYKASVEINFNNQVHTTTMNITKLDAGINVCNNIQAITEKQTDKFGFAIFNFNAAGGNLDGSDAAGQCGKMHFQGEIENPNAGQPNFEFNNYVIDGGTVTLVGKTYTMTCKAFKKMATPDNTIYNIKAVWTKP